MVNLFQDLWLGACFSLAILCLIVGIFFLNQAKKNKDLISLKSYSKGIALFMFIVGINGFLDFGNMYSNTVLGKNDLFPDTFKFLNYGRTSFYIIITLLMASLAVLSYQIEKYIKKNEKHILTDILIVCFFISLIPYVGFLIPADFHYAIMIIVYLTQVPFGGIILYWGVFYLSLAAKTSGIVRRRALLVGFGLGMVFTGILSDLIYRAAVPGEYIFPFFCFFVANLGIVFLIIGFKREKI
ncbi:MAG: hypothetical protein ACTSU2_08720 [Promethearchaeota archaeon]